MSDETNYTGIIFTVVGLFATTVLLSVCMSCYKCFVRRRRKALTSQAAVQYEAAVLPPNGSGVPGSSRGSVSKQGERPTRSNGRKYPKPTTSTVQHATTSEQQQQQQPGPSKESTDFNVMKRHSMYYSVESMASLASAVEEYP